MRLCIRIFLQEVHASVNESTINSGKVLTQEDGVPRCVHCGEEMGGTAVARLVHSNASSRPSV